ncbi:hypothetical protein GY15_20355 [Delftia sp. 670]|nr:hypothetical protein GY15_20355 [Delftia sp. 670]
MNIKRFYAPTSREALAKARMAFGAGTLILSNRSTPDGVEVMATAEDTLEHSKAAASSTPLQQAIERRSAEETTGLRPQLQAQLIQAHTQPRTAQQPSPAPHRRLRWQPRCRQMVPSPPACARACRKTLSNWP